MNELIAFGDPSRAQAWFYVAFIVGGATGAMLAGSVWGRVASGLICAYGLLCLVITNAWITLLPRHRR